MNISIKDFKASGKHQVSVDTELPVTLRTIGFTEYVFSKQPEIRGTITKLDKDIVAEFDVTVFIKEKCARCLEEDIKCYIAKVNGILSNDEMLEADEDYILMDNDNLDLDNILDIALIENIPLKTICKEDCIGLCPGCGVNLNTCKCSCDEKDAEDPRFSKLKDLLK